jgi:glycerate kinase
MVVMWSYSKVVAGPIVPQGATPPANLCFLPGSGRLLAMRVVIAPDKFAGTLSATEAASAISVGWRGAAPGDELILAPMSDGGPGFLDTVAAVFDGLTTATVQDALGRNVPAGWLLTDVGGTRIAVIESAQACGITRLAREELDPAVASSYGVGQLISVALASGARRILVGLGGTAANDGGAGLAQALGARLLDADGNDLPRGGAALERLVSVDRSGLDPRLEGVDVIAVADVDNPLLGERGASLTFGRQKGADEQTARRLDAALARLASVLGAEDVAATPGAGAAGGLGFGLMAFTGAVVQPGLTLVAGILGLRGKIAEADIVVTGEGRFDEQSLGGKVPVGVAAYAAEVGIPCLVLAGEVTVNAERAQAAGINKAYGLTPLAGGVAEAFAQPVYWLEKLAAQVAREWSSNGGPAGDAAPDTDRDATVSPDAGPGSAGMGS